MTTKTMNHLPSCLVLALALVPTTSGCGGGKNDDGADGSSTTGDDGYTGPCESTELWEWAMWGRLERGGYGENAVVDCRCSLDCAADQLCVGYREENPAWEPGAEEDIVPIFVETRCKDRNPQIIEPRYTNLQIETQPWPGPFCVDDEACAEGFRCFLGAPAGRAGYCIPSEEPAYCAASDLEPRYGCIDGTWCDRSAAEYVEDGVPEGVLPFLPGICVPGECVPDGEYCTHHNQEDSCCSGTCDPLKGICVAE